MNDAPQPLAPEAPAPLGRAPAVLVVDDERDLRELLSLTLVRMGLDVDTAESLGVARGHLAARSYALCLTDMRLPDGTGLDLVREVGAGVTKIAVITAFGSAENAVAALKAGAFDYLTKPVDLEQLRALVRTALRDTSVPPAVTPIPSASNHALGRLVGDSLLMQQLRSMILRVAQSMAPVAIFGESGSGKELIARAIHESSSRRALPFIGVNCGAIPETLMEAEFFGYKKGAFTGADRDREGFFQAAAGGTLFLDEVAELPLAMQVKLLRAIQERRVRKVGATQEEAVDVRLLSATHQDLTRLVASGRFRQDLFYRLNVIELHAPSLREQPEDIDAICAVILRRVVARGTASEAQLSAEAMAALRSYAFPGNVRELENILERALALAGEGSLEPRDLRLPESVAPAQAMLRTPIPQTPMRRAADIEVATGDAESTVIPNDLTAHLDGIERAAITAALEKTRSNRTAAAQLLGLTFRQMRYRMQRLGIK